MGAPVRPRARQCHRGCGAAAGATARQASAWRRRRDLRPAPDHRAPDRGDGRHAGHPASHGSWPATAPGLASATRNAGCPCGPSWPSARARAARSRWPAGRREIMAQTVRPRAPDADPAALRRPRGRDPRQRRW